ncbi:hypothetical protein E1176_16820 [Fulvivirga sp. RKSG066]|uniref:hypothetical protein n=1 Tax=Fulvivirga aurantia TaxID=2529383 RepID=UPI0012BBEECB|nr:hypothetical protein [Fulvivirga aurantia]MTI22698.1 hypothetical protein [Fulvivirga aurantia]
MNKIQQAIFGNLKEHFTYALALGATLLFFLYKGLIYLIIGSYIPLIVIASILMLFVLSSRKSEKAFKNTISFWTILVLIWSVVRLLLSLVNQFVKPVPESHVAEQFGISGLILSLLFLSGAIYLLRNKKKVFEK